MLNNVKHYSSPEIVKYATIGCLQLMFAAALILFSYIYILSIAKKII